MLAAHDCKRRAEVGNYSEDTSGRWASFLMDSVNFLTAGFPRFILLHSNKVLFVCFKPLDSGLARGEVLHSVTVWTGFLRETCSSPPVPHEQLWWGVHPTLTMKRLMEVRWASSPIKQQRREI